MLQEIASRAIVSYCEDSGNHYTGSCGYLISSAVANRIVNAVIIKPYKEFSGARDCDYGFKCIPYKFWDMMSEQDKERYREDILYYFWMANQEM